MNFPTRSLLYGTLLGLLILAAMAAALEFYYGPDRQGPVVTGEALVGGPFSLIDASGDEVSDTEFAARHMLIFFGYTNCPDVCPLGLQKISMALDMLEQQDINLTPLQPIFITIDPARDNPAVMGEYISAFHPAFIALTGSEEAIAAAAAAYLVHRSIAGEHEMEDDDHMDAAAGDQMASDHTATNYMMTHSDVIYLMDRDGRYVDHFNSTATPRDIADRLRPILD